MDGAAAGHVLSMTWWWCLEHNRVEQGPGCANMARLGPYASEQEAAGALDRTPARTEAEDARDAAEDDWGKKPD
jgi:hypothetical protein